MFPLEGYLGAVASGYYDIDWAHSRRGGLDAVQAKQMAALLSESLKSGHAASFADHWMQPRPTDLPGGQPHPLRVEWVDAFRDFLLVCGAFAIH